MVPMTKVEVPIIQVLQREPCQPGIPYLRNKSKLGILMFQTNESLRHRRRGQNIFHHKFNLLKSWYHNRNLMIRIQMLIKNTIWNTTNKRWKKHQAEWFKNILLGATQLQSRIQHLQLKRVIPIRTNCSKMYTFRTQFSKISKLNKNQIVSKMPSKMRKLLFFWKSN